MASLEIFPDQFSGSIALSAARNSSKSNYPDKFLSSKSNKLLADEALAADFAPLPLPWDSLLPIPVRDLATAVQNL